jgi:hypothetical protein
MKTRQKPVERFFLLQRKKKTKVELCVISK